MARWGPRLNALAPAHSYLCRVRRLHWNKLGPKGGMALAEALKSNNTLEYLVSAALPSNPPAHVHSVMLPGLAPHAHTAHTPSEPARLHTREPAAATHVPARRVDRGHALPCPTGGWRDVRAPSAHACTCPWQRGEHRPRRRRQAGPQGVRPQRTQPDPLASGLSPPSSPSSLCGSPPVLIPSGTKEIIVEHMWPACGTRLVKQSTPEG